jgi:hypothetical protein
MTDAFAAAADSLFADPHLAVAAIYQPQVGDPLPVRVVMSQPDTDSGLFDAGVRDVAVVASLRASEVAEPQEGDSLTIGSVTWRIRTRRRDALALLWRLELQEV